MKITGLMRSIIGLKFGGLALVGGFLFVMGQVIHASELSYVVNPGDMLEISVWNEEALQRELRVLPDGSASFPLVGNFKAAGFTVDEIQAALTERLAKYITDPVVTVSVKTVEGNTVYVLGKVNNPGHFQMYRPMTILQALSLAGGLGTFAKTNSIRVLRRDGDKTISIPFRYGDIEDGDNLESNILLRSGDVIIVP